MNILVILSSLVLTASSLSVERAGNLKAASPFTNCGCQCSSLTFVDSTGHIQGNCKSVDGTGAQWCYTDPSYGSSCQDLTPSARFPANPWSYEACSTPAIGSYECPSVHHPAPTVVVSPSDHHAPTVVVPSSPDHLHVAAPHHVVVPTHDYSHVTAPLVSGPIHLDSHYHRDEIPQGPFYPPIPKSSVSSPTK